MRAVLCIQWGYNSFAAAEVTEPFSETGFSTCGVTSWSSIPALWEHNTALSRKGSVSNFSLPFKHISETFLNRIGQKDAIIFGAFPLWQFRKCSYVGEVLCHPPTKWMVQLNNSTDGNQKELVISCSCLCIYMICVYNVHIMLYELCL